MFLGCTVRLTAAGDLIPKGSRFWVWISSAFGLLENRQFEESERAAREALDINRNVRPCINKLSYAEPTRWLGCRTGGLCIRCCISSRSAGSQRKGCERPLIRIRKAIFVSFRFVSLSW